MAKYEKCKIDEIVPNDWNPNRIDIRKMDALRRRIKAVDPNLQLQPIVCRRRKKKLEIIDGEHRWRAAKDAGSKHVHVVIVESKNEEARLSTLSFNLLRGEPDVMNLSVLLKGLSEEIGKEPILDATGMIDDELDEYLQFISEGTGDSEEDELIEDEEMDRVDRTEVFCVSLTPTEKKRLKSLMRKCDGKTLGDRFMSLMSKVKERSG